MKQDLSKSILSAIASSYGLMSSGSDMAHIMDDVLGFLGSAARVDRVYVFKNHEDSEGNDLFSQAYEWVAEGIEPQISNPMLQEASWDGLEYLKEILLQKKPYAAIVSEIESTSLRIALASQDILSVLFLPIFVNNYFWGWMGFDNCQAPVKFSEEQQSALHALSSSIGNHIAMESAAKELELANKRMSLVLDSTQSGFWDISVGPEPSFYFSDSIFHILGLEVQNDTMDLELFEQLLLPDYKYIAQTLHLYISEPIAKEVNERFAMFNSLGNIVWFQARGKVIEFNNQFKFIGVIHDITSEKKALDSLKDNEIFVQGLLETITETLFSLNLQKEFVFLSPAWVSLTGIKPSESLGKSIFDWVVPEFKPMLSNLFQELLENPNKSGEVEIQIVTSGLLPIWVNFSATFVESFSHQGAFRGVIVSMDEKKKAALELASSRLKLENIINTVDDVLYTYNPQTQFFSFVSNALEKKGISLPRDASGGISAQEWLKIINPEDLLLWTKAHARLQDEGRYEVIYRVRPTENSPVIWIQDTARQVYDKEQNALLVHGLMSDVTEMQLIKNRLEQSEKQFKRIALKLPAPLMVVDSAVKESLFANEKVIEQVNLSDHKASPYKFLKDNNALVDFLLKVSKDLDSGRVYDTELQIRIHDKSFWYSVSANGIHMASGLSIAVVFNNINPIKEAENKLFKTNRIVGALNQANMYLNESNQFESAMEKLLQTMVQVSEADIGIMGEIIRGDDNTPRVVLHSKVSSDTEVFEGQKICFDGHALAEIILNEVEIENTDSDSYCKLEKHAIEKLALQFSMFNKVNEVVVIPSLEGKELLGFIILASVNTKTLGSAILEEIMPLVHGYARFINAHRVNQERDKTQALYNLISSNTLDVIAVHEPDLTFSYVSPSIEKMIGYSPSEIIGKKPSVIFGVPEPHQMLLEEKKMVLPHNHKNGGVVDVEVLMKPIFDSEGNLKSYLAAARDVTERETMLKNLENALESQKELGVLKSKFVSMVSHEFRTPVSTILSSAELLQMSMLNSDLTDKEHVTKHVNRIKYEVKRIIKLLNDVLILEKHAQGKQTVSPQKVRLVEILGDQLREIFSFREDVSRLVFEKIPPDLVINTDPQIVSHILINLVENAFKYSEAPKPIKVLTNEDKQWVYIHVIDYGMGIPHKEQSFLFESFFRASNASKISGTGLGLSIVKQFVELLQGSLRFESIENQGTEFVVSLPKQLK